MTDRELLKYLTDSVSRKCFSGSPDISENGPAYERACANTGGVGFACFATSHEQNKAFSDAFAKEARAAGPYIYALEKELIRLLAAN